jgi:kynureninase
MTDSLLAWRREFPILERSTYLVSHSLGAMPRGVFDALHDYAETWAGRGVRAWAEGWWTSATDVGDLLAPLLGAAPGTVAMQPNVSTALAALLSTFEFRPPRSRIVAPAITFPTALYACAAAARAGAELALVPSEDGSTVELERLLDAIDQRTRVVVLSHVEYKSGFLHRVEPVVERAHAVGANLILDCYQSAGCVPIELERWNVDFAVGGSVKWLLGGPGAGYAYARPDLWPTLRPEVTGWAAHAEPFAFEPPPVRLAPDVRRLLSGTPAVPALLAARVGYDIVRQVGIGPIREKNRALTQRLIDLADQQGLRVASPRDPERRGSMVVLDVPDGAGVVAELGRREILVDYRPDAGIRVSPHFYTTEDELEHAMTTLRELIEQGVGAGAAAVRF